MVITDHDNKEKRRTWNTSHRSGSGKCRLVDGANAERGNKGKSMCINAIGSGNGRRWVWCKFSGNTNETVRSEPILKLESTSVAEQADLPPNAARRFDGDAAITVQRCEKISLVEMFVSLAIDNTSSSASGSPEPSDRGSFAVFTRDLHDWPTKWSECAGVLIWSNDRLLTRCVTISIR